MPWGILFWSHPWFPSSPGFRRRRFSLSLEKSGRAPLKGRSLSCSRSSWRWRRSQWRLLCSSWGYCGFLDLRSLPGFPSICCWRRLKRKVNRREFRMTDNIQAIAQASAAPEKLLQMMTGYWVTQAVYVAAKLGIADLLSDGPVSCDELASKTGTHARSLRRTLRALASVGVFSEVEPGQFALTPMAGLLRKDAPHSMRALAIMYAEEQYRA